MECYATKQLNISFLCLKITKVQDNFNKQQMFIYIFKYIPLCSIRICLHYLVPNVSLRLDSRQLDISNAMFHQKRLSPLVSNECMVNLQQTRKTFHKISPLYAYCTLNFIIKHLFYTSREFCLRIQFTYRNSLNLNRRPFPTFPLNSVHTVSSFNFIEHD